MMLATCVRTPPQGLMCCVSSDERVEGRWGAGYIERKYGVHGVKSIWDDWGRDSGILPCPVYLRHCVLASQKHVRPSHSVGLLHPSALPPVEKTCYVKHVWS
jgi:hypothetical protein